MIFGTRFPSRLFVGCLPENATAMELGTYFQQYGRVLEAKVLVDNFGRSKKYGFVSFTDEGSVHRVLAKQPIVFKGKVINVGAAVKKDRKEWSQNVSSEMKMSNISPVIPPTSNRAQQMPSEINMPVKYQLPLNIKPHLFHIHRIPSYVSSLALDYSANNIHELYQNTAYTCDYTKYNPLMM